MANHTYKLLVDPRGEQLTGIIDGLTAFGLEQSGGESPLRIAVICETPQGDQIGGAIGHSLRQRFYLTQLWVAEPYRSHGIGSDLMARIETIAKERGCKDIVVDTLNKKAVSFYQRLGYREYLVNPHYIRGFDWHFLSKLLDV